MADFVRQERLDPDAQPAVARALIGCGKDAYEGHLTGQAQASVIPHLVDVAGAAVAGARDETVQPQPALTLLHQEEPVNARPFYERALTVRERSLGPDHPDTGLSLHNLASLLRRQGNLAAAGPFYEPALDGRLAYCPDGPLTQLGRVPALAGMGLAHGGRRSVQRGLAPGRPSGRPGREAVTFTPHSHSGRMLKQGLISPRQEVCDMSVMRRMSDVVQEKLNAILGRVEDPSEAIDLAYEKQLESLQQVRRSVADVLTSQKRIELQAAELRQSQQKLQAQAREALGQGREDLARLALTRAQSIQEQLTGLDTQAQQLKDQEQKLEVTAQKLQAKVEAFRTQKETIKAQYSAAQASTRIGEAVTGLSEQMADVSLMVDRAEEKTKQMQARSAAIDQLIDSGALDQIGGTQDDIDRQLRVARTDAAVETQLQALKQQLGGPPAPAHLPPATVVVRVLGGDQYELKEAQAQLDAFDERLRQALDAGDGAAFDAALAEAITFVKAHGTELPAHDLRKSELVLPAPDTSLEDARKLLAPGAAGG